MTGPKSLAHTNATLEVWRRLRHLRTKTAPLVLDGNSLDVAAVVAVARHGVNPVVSSDPELARQLDLSVEALAAYLARDWVVYGVNTGFGGSADSRTASLVDLQMHLLQHTQSAIVTSADKHPAADADGHAPHVMPPEWVRAAIAARANQNLRGHSAVRLSVLRSLVDLLHHDLTPLVPLRGTISASGDLMPLSYIAGALCGNPDVFIQVGRGPAARVVPAPSGLGPKEGLGLINGTAPSVAVASLVLHDAHHLALLAQMLTALAAEALGGNVEWAQPFIHAARPHAGQVEAAGNIRRFLKGSRMVVGLEARRRKGHGLWQDRYSTRTAPQWIGPYLEDLLLAQRQLEVELNSTSDNPLVDASPDSPHQPPRADAPAVGDVYSGGNFQAAVVTSAMDKTRLALQMIGRLLYSQVTEMINPATNNGLEANLNASVHENFTMKGIDVNVSAYISELAALAHPVSSHVMSAEMHNQGVNSLALLSARRTAEAADLVAHMCACHLYVSCQAVEMRANHHRFLDALRDRELRDPTHLGALHGLGLAGADVERLAQELLPVIESTWYHWNAHTWRHRAAHVAEAVMAPVADFLAAEGLECSVSQLAAFRKHFEAVVSKAAASCFGHCGLLPTSAVAARLGSGGARLYTWLRSRLGVPLHRGIDDDPLYNARKGLPTEDKKTIGSWVTIVYESILGGGLLDMAMDGIESSHEAPRIADEFESLCREMAEIY